MNTANRYVLRDEYGYVRASWESEPSRDELLSAAGMAESMEYYRGCFGWEHWPEGHDPDADARAENEAAIAQFCGRDHY